MTTSHLFALVRAGAPALNAASSFNVMSPDNNDGGGSPKGSSFTGLDYCSRLQQIVS